MYKKQKNAPAPVGEFLVLILSGAGVDTDLVLSGFRVSVHILGLTNLDDTTIGMNLPGTMIPVLVQSSEPVRERFDSFGIFISRSIVLRCI